MNKFACFFLCYLAVTTSQARAFEIEQPGKFQLGASYQGVLRNVSDVCERIVEHDIVPITAPLAKHSHKQIDCYGFEYAGKPRKVELVFQDDQLDLIWILIAEAEKKEIIAKMTKAFGAPSMVIDYGAIFLQVNAAVRNQPSEVLFASTRQVEAMLSALSKTEQ